MSLIYVKKFIEKNPCSDLNGKFYRSRAVSNEKGNNCTSRAVNFTVQERQNLPLSNNKVKKKELNNNFIIETSNSNATENNSELATKSQQPLGSTSPQTPLQTKNNLNEILETALAHVDAVEVKQQTCKTQQQQASASERTETKTPVHSVAEKADNANADPYAAQATNVLTDWNLYLGNLNEQGVILVQHFYDGFANRNVSEPNTVDIEGVEIPVANRNIGCAMLLVSPEELSHVVWLRKDGERILWREGDDLINGERFLATEQLYYSDEMVQSINKRAYLLFNYLLEHFPELSHEEIAHKMGYTLNAINRILKQEEVSSTEDDEASDDADEEENTPFNTNDDV